jgi:hypothetical protein
MNAFIDVTLQISHTPLHEAAWHGMRPKHFLISSVPAMLIHLHLGAFTVPSQRLCACRSCAVAAA